VRETIVALLETHGHRVAAAPSGALMREILREDALPDIVILDCLMPGEASPSLALHPKEPRLPVVMISGIDDAMIFAREHKLQLLTKPFGEAQLLAALDAAMASDAFGQRDA